MPQTAQDQYAESLGLSPTELAILHEAGSQRQVKHDTGFKLRTCAWATDLVIADCVADGLDPPNLHDILLALQHAHIASHKELRCWCEDFVIPIPRLNLH